MTLFKTILISFWFISFISVTRGQDTLIMPMDTSPIVEKSFKEEKIAEHSLESKLIYGSIDSQSFDLVKNQMHLYGEAFVNYEDKKLFADYILLDMDNNYADAQRLSSSPPNKKMTFFDGKKEYSYNRLKYDFESEVGNVYDAIFTEGEFLIHGERTKYVSAKSNKYSDDDTGYNANSLITTCTHEHPHFGFRAKKLKVVPEKVAVLGPSNLEISGIPTPIWLPFGFYPLAEGKSSGFIFPSDYEFNSKNKGFGLRGLGWYFPISDYVHLRLTADVYTRGSYAVYANTNYKKKYKYNGSLYLSLDDTRTEDIETAKVISNKGYTIILNHKQDSKAHPFVNVGGNIKIVGKDNQRRTFNDAENVLTNTYTSNFSYSHSMPGTPFSFSLGLNHNQNTNTRIVNLTFPDVKLNMNTIYPFKNKNRGSNQEKWYEKISFDYDTKLKSFVQTTDSTMFTQEMYDDIKTGMNHKLNTGFSTRLFKHFNIVPSADYEETLVLNTIQKENFIRYDTTTQRFQDSIVQKTVTGYDNFRNYSARININTQLFGTKSFSKGWLRGVRHTLKPSIGYAFAPDKRSTYTDSLELANEKIQRFTRFDNGPFNTPAFSDLSSRITYSLNNVIEIKYFSKKDSIEKKLKLFDNISMNGDYNFAADSLKWSRITMRSTSRFFKGITTLTSDWTFDPYLEENNSAINKTVWSKRKSPLRLERGTIRLSNRASIKQLQEIFGKKKTSEKRLETEDDPEEEDGFGSKNSERIKDSEGNTSTQLISVVDILNSITINYEIKLDLMAIDDRMINKLSTHTISITGSIPLTDNWSMSIGNLGYDFVRNGLSYTAVSFNRKLHCWNMRFSWFPNRDTYSFSIGVNSSNLSFLKYDYGQNNVDGLFNKF